MFGYWSIAISLRMMGLKYVIRLLIIVCFKELLADKKGKATCPGDRSVRLSETCYYFLSDPKSWNQAQADCESREGTLLIFESQSEAAKILKEIKKIVKDIDTVAMFWLGVHNQDSEGVFRWADGSDVIRPNWKKLLEDATGGNCVALKSNNGGEEKKWTLEACSRELPYICEIRLVAPYWSGWGVWGQCSVTCGDGGRTRYRSCLNPTGDSPGCSGKSVETHQCSVSQCAVWENWQQWGDCSVTCGEGQRSRSRKCLSKKDCKGDTFEKELCTMPECPVWENWQEWGDCSVTCGEGQRSRSRKCLSKKDCKGDKFEKELCKMPECPAWGTWRTWSSCSVTCGKGVIKRSRSCSGNVKGACRGDNSQWKTCSEPSCRDKANWTTWGLWEACSVACGVGTRTRQRQCVNGFGQTDTCKGAADMRRRCLSPCREISQVKKLLTSAAPDEVNDLKKIMKKLSNKKLKEEVFTGTDMEDWVIVGYELDEVTVDRPLSCARLCIRFPNCQSFNYEDRRDADGKNNLIEPKLCVLNSVNKSNAGDGLQKREGFKLFDLEPFFM